MLCQFGNLATVDYVMDRELPSSFGGESSKIQKYAFIDSLSSLLTITYSKFADSN